MPPWWAGTISQRHYIHSSIFLIWMCTKDYLFLKLCFNLLFQIFYINRAFCSLCCFHYAGSQVDSIEIPVIQFAHIHHQSSLRDYQTGAASAIIHTNNLYVVIFPTFIFTCFLCHTLKHFRQPPTQLTPLMFLHAMIAIFFFAMNYLP